MYFNRYNTCRFCDAMMSDDLVKYGVRHYAHYECYLKAGKKLSDLPPWQIAKFPYRLLKQYGVLDEAERLTKEHLARMREIEEIV